MSILIDQEYISLISVRLEGFIARRNGVYNCRCPLCGDSVKHKRKKRFYFYQRKGVQHCRCHNCGYSRPFSVFLRDFDFEMYRQYQLDHFTENLKQKEYQQAKQQDHIKLVLEHESAKRKTIGFDYRPLTHFGTMHPDHPARQYVDRRLLPHDRIFYCPNLTQFVSGLAVDEYIIEQFQNLPIPFMIIPFWVRKGISRVFQARTFDPSFKPKYMTFKLDEDDLKIFGMDRINPHKIVYMLEGPIDSMCIDNSLAFSGLSAELPPEVKTFRKAYFYDNEPRNQDVAKQMQRVITAGESIVILDNVNHNDVNDMYIAGINVDRLFKEHTYQGPLAQLKFNAWKRT